MGTVVVRELTAEERARMPLARQEMEVAGAQGCATRFTFFAAFDGTNNDEGNLKLSGDPYPTNISRLGEQARDAAENRQESPEPDQHGSDAGSRPSSGSRSSGSSHRSGS